MTTISLERAERISRAHACAHCSEYSFRKVTVKAAPDSIKDELGAIWVSIRHCGVCKHQSELGLDAEGDIVFES